MLTSAAAPPRVLLLRDRDDDVGAAIADGCAGAGWDVRNCTRWSSHELDLTAERFHTVLGYGPHNGSMLSAARLLTRFGPERPRFIWWLCENAPDVMATSSRLVAGATVRRLADRLLDFQDGDFSPTPLRSLLTRGHRDRVLGELFYFRQRGLLDRLVVSSPERARRLQRLGFEAITVPLGYSPGRHGSDLQSSRDIDVMFMGRPGSARRGRILRALANGLEAHGVRLTINGPERWVDGERRAQLLNRVKILVNVFKAPGDFTGHRLILGMANKALVVTEPFVDAAPFVPGVHFIEALPADLAHAVAQALRDEGRRLEMVERAYSFIQSDLKMAELCRQVLSAVGEPPASCATSC